MRVVLLAALGVFLAFSAAEAAPLHVVASFSILADLTREVAGGEAEVVSVVPPGGDAHVYEPTPSDAKTLSHADLVIINGLGFEGWLDRLVAASGYKGPVTVASAGVAARMLDGRPDPHAWQSVSNGKIYVANIRDALMHRDPSHAALYARNAATYNQKLDTLDAWVQAQIATVPRPRRKAITTHDALGYFAARYGVVFIAPLGLTTESDVSAGAIARLIDQMRAQHIRALFLENMADPRLMRMLAEEGGAAIGGTLYTDSLSAPDGPAPTYLLMFRHNVKMIIQALLANG